MHSDLTRLIKLQQLENSAQDARQTIAEGPERRAALEARLAYGRELVAAATQRLAENQTAKRALEKDLAVVQGRLSKFRDQLMEVKTNREYQAMQKEIEVAQREVRQKEDHLLERMIEADELTAATRQAEVALASEQAAVAADRRALDNELASLDAELAAVARAREALVAEISSHAMAVFDQVARQRRGVAVAEARGGLCTICHVRLRPQVFNDVRRNDSLIQCDSCQRILYFVPSPSAAIEAEPGASGGSC